MIEVTITGDWSDPGQALSDIATAMGGATPGNWSVGVVFTLWGGESAPDSFLEVTVECGGSPSYTGYTGAQLTGTAYVVGITLSAQEG